MDVKVTSNVEGIEYVSAGGQTHGKFRLTGDLGCFDDSPLPSE